MGRLIVGELGAKDAPWPAPRFVDSGNQCSEFDGQFHGLSKYSDVSSRILLEDVAHGDFSFP